MEVKQKQIMAACRKPYIPNVVRHIRALPIRYLNLRHDAGERERERERESHNHGNVMHIYEYRGTNNLFYTGTFVLKLTKGHNIKCEKFLRKIR